MFGSGRSTAGLALTVLASTALLVPTAHAAQDPEPTVTPLTSLTLDVAPSVWEDRSLPMSGLMSTSTPADDPDTDPDPEDPTTPPSPPTMVTSPVAGAPVRLWWRPAGRGAWRPAGPAVRTAADGRWRATSTWARPGRVEVQARSGALVVDRRVLVRDRRVTLRQPRRSARVLLDRVPLSGRVVPAAADVPVTVRVRRPGGGWRTLRTRSNRTGAWQVRVGPWNRTGRLVARARSGQGPGLERSVDRRTTLRAVFAASDAPVTPATVRHSFRSGCPVGPSDLVLVRMTYRDYAGTYRWGRMVMARTGRRQIVSAFRTGFAHGFRIHHMSLVERYRGHDPSAMAANNTSAFNCRRVTGNPYALSPHAWGTAVDINTVQNPYQDSYGRWWPSRNKWVHRGTQHPGMISASSPIRSEFGRHGFQWGGFWSHPDWQHFDPRGRLRPRGPGPTESPALTRALPAVLPGGLVPAPVLADHDNSPALPETWATTGRAGTASTTEVRRPREVLAALRFSCGTPPGAVHVEAAVQRGYRPVGARPAGARGQGTTQALVLRTTSATGARTVEQWVGTCTDPAFTHTVDRLGPRLLRLVARPAG